MTSLLKRVWEFNSAIQRNELEEALRECMCLDTLPDRIDLRRKLPDELRTSIADHDNLRNWVTSAVTTCIGYSWGMEWLLDQIWEAENNSAAARKLSSVIQGIFKLSISPCDLYRGARLLEKGSVFEDDIYLSFQGLLKESSLIDRTLNRSIVRCIMDLLAEYVDGSTVLDFVYKLVPLINEPYVKDYNTRRGAVWDWINEVADENRIVSPVPREEITAPITPKRVYLLIALKPMNESDQPSYSVVLWKSLQEAGQLVPLILESEPLIIENQHLPDLFEKCLALIEMDHKIDQRNVTIELFLANRQLVQWPAGWLRGKKQRIGQYCPVVVRPLVRLFDWAFWSEWRKRVNNMPSGRPLTTKELVWLNTDTEPEWSTLRKKLTNAPGIHGLIFSRPPRPEWLDELVETLIVTGIALAIWPNDELAPKKYRRIFVPLLTGNNPSRLPEAVFDKMSEIFKNSEQDKPSEPKTPRITLLWDDYRRCQALQLVDSQNSKDSSKAIMRRPVMTLPGRT